jgi:hypothetical protein
MGGRTTLGDYAKGKNLYIYIYIYMALGGGSVTLKTSLKGGLATPLAKIGVAGHPHVTQNK